MSDALGLSIGTTNLVAARNGSSPVTRRAVLTLFAHRAPQIGLPDENPGVAETGTLVAGFVERVGGAGTVESGQGSTHDPALLLVEALDAMIAAAGGDAATSDITIAVPAYWGSPAVAALRDALRTHPGFVRSGTAPQLVSDAVAALTALNSGARLPSRGVVGLLDFGGGGTSITLADAGSGFLPIAPTVRYPEFSGDHLDEALLVHVLDGLGHLGEFDPESTAAVGQLGQLRESVRKAKERLSTDAVTEVVADLPARRAAVELRRTEFEKLIRDRLSGVLAAFDDVLSRNNINRRDLAAVAMAGGGASIPVVAQRVSSHAKASVVTAAQPAFAMAVGAVMIGAKEPGEEIDDEVAAPTAMAALAGAGTGGFRAATGTLPVPTDNFDATTGGFSASTGSFGLPVIDEPLDGDKSSTLRKLAWSEADDIGNEPVFYSGEPYGRYGNDDDDRGVAPPSRYFPKAEEPIRGRSPRGFRVPGFVIGLLALIAMAAVGGVAYSLMGATGRQAPPAPATSTAVPPPVSSPPPSPSPPPPAPSAEPSPSVEPPPPPSSTEPPPPPPPVTTTYAPPPTTTQAPPTSTQPTTTTTTPPTTTTTTPPPTSSTPTTTVPMTTEYLRLPMVPVPIPIQVPQNQAPQPQNPYLGPGGSPGGGFGGGY
jgi:hypothetical protein